MKQSVKHLLLTVLVALVSVSASAHDFEVDGIYYKVVSLSDLTCQVTYEGNDYGSAKYTGDVKIPSTVTYNGKTLSVTCIGYHAFYNCESLTSIEIPNSVTSIGSWAFRYCTSLTSIEIPNSVTSIGSSAFSYCTSLTSVEIPNSVTSIGDQTFDYCKSLTSVEIPNSVTSIGDHAFGDCSSLTSIEIPNSVTSIGSSAFTCCTSLTSVEIPNSVTGIGDQTFYKCKSLTSVVIPNSVTNIGNDVFIYCDKLSQIEVGNSYTIGKIGSYAKKLIIVDDYVDTSFPNISYTEYEKLDTLVCKLSTPPTLHDNFSNAQYMNLVVMVPTNSLATYQSADVWKDFWCLQGGAEKETTGIATPTIDTANKPDVIYDLNGRRLTSPKKGLNIINGKKVVVK